MRVAVNFASREYMLARKAYVALIVGVAASLCLLAYQFTLYASAADKVSSLESFLGNMQSVETKAMERYREISGPVKQEEITRTRKEVNFANTILVNKSFSWTLFLNRLEVLIPRGVGVTTISPDFKTLSVSISGSADNMDKLIGFIENLTESEYFADLPPNFSTTRQIADKDTGKTVEVFNLSIKYYPDGKGGKKDNKEGKR